MLKEIPDLSEQNVTAEGVVVFILSHIGSKSERPLPYLRTDGAKDTRLFFSGDKTYENATLWPYNGKKVRVTGDKNRGGLLIVREIELLEDVKAGEAQEKSLEQPPASAESQPSGPAEPAPVAPATAESLPKAAPMSGSVAPAPVASVSAEPQPVSAETAPVVPAAAESQPKDLPGCDTGASSANGGKSPT